MNYKPQIKIEVANKVKFSSLSNGDTFLYEGRLYQKGRFSNDKHCYNNVGAWDIHNGDQIYFHDTELVEPRCISITVESP